MGRAGFHISCHLPNFSCLISSLFMPIITKKVQGKKKKKTKVARLQHPLKLSQRTTNHEELLWLTSQGTLEQTASAVLQRYKYVYLFQETHKECLNQHKAESLLFVLTSDHHCSLTKLTHTTVYAAVYGDCQICSIDLSMLIINLFSYPSLHMSYRKMSNSTKLLS